MALNRTDINIAFVCVVAFLGVTAAVFSYRNFKQPESHVHQAQEVTGNQLPENHPVVDFSSMKAELEQRIAADPKNPVYLIQMANLYYDNGKYDQAADYYKQSLDLRPQDPHVETDLATCYYNLGQSDKALETLDRVLKYSPGFSQALFNKGVVLINARKDMKGGIAAWESLLQSDPDFARKAGLEQMLSKIKAMVQ